MAIFQRNTTINLKLFNWRQPKTIKFKDQSLFLQTLHELLIDGFSMSQALVFMEILLPQYRPLIKILVEHLEAGMSLEKGLRQIGYPLEIVAQLFYAQKQGRFYESLLTSANALKRKYDYYQQMIKTLSYPSIMFLFLLVLLLGMRAFLLPHIVSFITEDVYQTNMMIQLLVTFFSYLPQILLGFLGSIIIICLLVDLLLLRCRYLTRMRVLLKVPLLNKWLKMSSTYKVSKTLGYFIAGGFSMQQTLAFIMQYPIDPFLSELAQVLHDELLGGAELSVVLNQSKLFRAEFGMVIQQGELTSQVAKKCLMYAEKIYSDMMDDIAKKISYLQPLLFILIAVLVMSMYLLMMLPMLTMEGI